MSVSASKEAKRAEPVRDSSSERVPAGVLAGLRAAVARIEGTPQRFAEGTPQRFAEGTPQRFAEGPSGGARRARSDVLPLGFPAMDAALGGGWPRAGLAELHGDDTQGIGAATGFALALASLFGASARRPLLWIGTRHAFAEAGRLHGPGLLAAGLDPSALLCVGTHRLAEAVWAAEEAARAGLAGLAVLEVRGNPSTLGLEGSRRLHLRAGVGGAPLVLLRQGGRAEATAAPLRLRVAASRSPSPSASIPAFRLAVEKARRTPPQEIVVGWNVHERRFESLALTSGSRMLALCLPQLPTDRIRRREQGPNWRAARRLGDGGAALVPLGLFERIGNADRIAATCELARGAGLRPGLGLAEARARFPLFDFRERDHAADRNLLEAVADWCDRYTPLVAVDPPDGLTLDVAGCAHLFGGEKALLGDLLARLFAFGFTASASVAGGAGTARALARGGATRHVEPGEEAAAVDALPLEALRLDPGLLATLKRLGLKSVGQLLLQPRAPLARRFGEALLARLDEAAGRRHPSLSPRLPVALIAERRFAEPLVLQEDVERVLLFLAGRLEGDLEKRGHGGRRFELALFRVDGHVDRVVVGASRPLRNPNEVALLFRERFAGLREDLDSGFGYDLIRLSVPVSAPLSVRQASLAAEGDDRDPERLAALIDRLAARLGEVSVTALGPMESHWPERAERVLPPAVGGNGAWRRDGSGAPRPARLLERPEQVSITQSLPDGPPLNFRWRRALHVVRRYEGPERIAPEWWRTGGEDIPTRDYYRVEDENGRRYWLFRQEGAETFRPDWFIHGLFA